MNPFSYFQTLFETQLQTITLPNQPKNLYEPCNYILKLGGKRIRPILVFMANELFGSINNDTYNAALAIEFFHNFTLIHDDIMDGLYL